MLLKSKALCLCEINQSQKSKYLGQVHRDRKENGGPQELGKEGEMGRWRFIGTEFQFRITEKF